MKEKNAYVYSSTELSRYYGISVKGMEFYEQKNLLHPERIGPGKIRRYHLLDCYQLAEARMLRNCGFCVEKTAELLENNHPDYLQEEFEARGKEMEAEIRQQEAVLEGIRRIQDGIRRVHEDPGPSLVEHEGFYRLFIRLFSGEHTSTSDESEQFSLWNSLMPISEASLLYDMEELKSEAAQFNTEVGMIMSAENFDRFHLEKSDRISFIPPGLAVHAIAEGPQTELDHPGRLSPLLRFIEEHHLEITGDAFSRLIFVMQSPDGQQMRYDDVWIPVSSNTKQK